MSVFAAKLGGLPATVDLSTGGPVGVLAGALRLGRGRTVAAVGSGGSAVAAEYLARCRTTLGLGPTEVFTPMEFVLGDSRSDEVWLFSAGASNPDVAAAYRTARSARTPVRLVTARSDGATSRVAAQDADALVLVLPVADPKDGFLATHSLVASIEALRLAGASLAGTDPTDARRAGEGVVEAIASWTQAADPFSPGDTVIIAHDPQARAVATLLDTCLWETGIAPSQRVDLRNFAHGRHVWAARHPEATIMLAITSAETRAVWEPIERALPTGIRRARLDVGNAGRSAIARGILSGLGLVGAIGERAGVDPGRPGHGPFAGAIYEDDALDRLAASLSPAVQHKRRANLLQDPTGDAGHSMCDLGRQRARDLADATFNAVVLDYDGTVVELDERFEPPSAEMAAEITRLVDDGVRVGIATGRGGSAGEDLRKALPGRVHPLVTIGYYNGGYVRTLDVDVARERPPQDPDVLAAHAWLAASGLLRDGTSVKAGELQITVTHDRLRDLAGFAAAARRCPGVAEGRLRVARSQHSFDILPAGSSKMAVVRALSDDPGAVLGLGDSGGDLGNDRELLLGCRGISVDAVCGTADGCWTALGAETSGPRAALAILRALRPGPDGAKLDVAGLGLDA